MRDVLDMLACSLVAGLFVHRAKCGRSAGHERVVYSIMECGVVVLAVNTAVVDAEQPRNVGTTPKKMITTCRLLLRTRPC